MRDMNHGPGREAKQREEKHEHEASAVAYSLLGEFEFDGDR